MASNKFFRWIGALLGVSMAVACGGKAEYGCPYATFRVSGKVVDETDKPVKNIIVAAGQGKV